MSPRQPATLLPTQPRCLGFLALLWGQARGWCPGEQSPGWGEVRGCWLDPPRPQGLRDSELATCVCVLERVSQLPTAWPQAEESHWPAGLGVTESQRLRAALYPQTQEQTLAGGGGGLQVAQDTKCAVLAPRFTVLRVWESKGQQRLNGLRVPFG